MKVLCRHNNLTAKVRNFFCKGREGKLSIPLNLGLPVTVDEEIALRYPDVFTIIPQALPQDEVIESDPVDEADEVEIIEPEATEEVGTFTPGLTGLHDYEEDSEFYGDSEPGELPGKEQLKEVIMEYKTKKKLAEYAKDCEVELESKTLKAMKEELIALWEL